MSIFRTFFRKNQDPSYFITKILLFLLLLLHIVARFIPPLKDFLKNNGIYDAVVLGATLLIVTQLDIIIANIKISLANPFKKKSITSASSIIDKVQNYDYINFYIGTYDEAIVKALLENTKFDNINIKYYLNPEILNKFDITTLIGKKSLFYISNVPIDSIVVLYFIADSCDQLEIIRPLRNGKFYSVEVKNDSEFINAFQQNYANCYERKNSFDINNQLVCKLVTYFHKKRDDELVGLFNNSNLNIALRSQFFEYGIELVKIAKHSLLAVDFIPPELWVNDPIVRQYADVHKVNVPTKKRIHIYNADKIKIKHSAYLEYMRLMKEARVDLFFLDEKNFDRGKYEKRGTLIIDNCCGIIAINPEDGATFGEVELNPFRINEYNKRFEEIYKKVITKEEFEKILNV